MKEWKDAREGHNLTLHGEGFYISYLTPNAMSRKYGWGASDDEEIGETALVWEKPWSCKILNGDFRKEYEEVIDQGYDVCLELFNSKHDFRSSWSD